MKKIELSIVIPCLNEKSTIQLAILDAKKYGRKFFKNSFEIIVSDNGSTDGSLKIISKHRSVRLIKAPTKGYGAALHWGVMASRGEYVVFADADMSYPFSNLGKFKKKLIHFPDLILGSRFKGRISKNAMPLHHRYIGTPLLTFLIRLIYKIPTSDCNSGMRFVKKSFYKKLNMRNSGMEWASELLLKTALKKGTYEEVPITYLKDKRGRSPHLSSWSDGWRHLKAILLLKPQSLYPLLVVFSILTLFFYKRSFAFSFLFADLFVVLILSLLTLDLLGAIIENKQTVISKFLLKFQLVPVTITVSLVIGILISLIPESRLGLKLFLVSQLSITFMWIFLIETIKTHLANRLPELQ